MRRILPAFLDWFNHDHSLDPVNVSSDTALRDIKDLIEKGILQETGEGGRSVNYELAGFAIE